jgi:carbon-monoxide dehydrogenase medium subunit
MEDKKCAEARIAMGAVAPTPIRCVKAEEMINGKTLDKALIDKCAEEAVSESNPIDDQRATAWYRRKAGAVLVAQALAKVAGIEI